MAGLEPTNAGVKVLCLTTWLHPFEFLSYTALTPSLDGVSAWGGIWGSNPRHPEPQSGALPTELIPPYEIKVARQEGLEPPAYCLEGSCSIQLSYWRIYRAAEGGEQPSKIGLERVMGIEPTSPAWKAGALAVVLHPHLPVSMRLKDNTTYYGKLSNYFSYFFRFNSVRGAMKAIMPLIKSIFVFNCIK